MIPKIDWREIVHLYGLTLLTVTGFFLLGLYVGRRLPAETGSARLAVPVSVGSSGSESKPRLEFYGRLNDPTNRGGVGGETRTAPLPQPGTEGAGVLNDGQSASSGGDRFTVQIAAMEQMEEARREQIRLRARGYPAEIRRLGPNDRFYRVWVGNFASKEKAEPLVRQLYLDGFPSYIRRTSDSQ